MVTLADVARHAQVAPSTVHYLLMFAHRTRQFEFSGTP